MASSKGSISFKVVSWASGTAISNDTGNLICWLFVMYDVIGVAVTSGSTVAAIGAIVQLIMNIVSKIATIFFKIFIILLIQTNKQRKERRFVFNRLSFLLLLSFLNFAQLFKQLRFKGQAQHKFATNSFYIIFQSEISILERFVDSLTMHKFSNLMAFELKLNVKLVVISLILLYPFQIKIKTKTIYFY
ncbi:hypothetical protein RFI_38383 [Reticulomyxa filosa]|uniref:Uncharacterized protein n=1 Tax=Reticulomyxa filosa TaxID=46433 RepID=X6LEC2_RETFI|nr:hypothetical protein RFI_38383 [Reticulomyxa filosa]|eukprot:ETN99104.1 hypothetical protein RFI_38383 [Reticulomyxa filosa]